MQWGPWVFLPSWSFFFLKSWALQLKPKVSLNCSLFSNSVSVPCPVIILLFLSPEKPGVVLHGQSLQNNNCSVVKVVQEREKQRAVLLRSLPETQTKGHLSSDGFAIVLTLERTNYYLLRYSSLSMVINMYKTSQITFAKCLKLSRQHSEAQWLCVCLNMFKTSNKQFYSNSSK